MRVFKKTYTDKEGKARTYEKWYLEIADHRGRRRKFSGYKDKRNTETLGGKIEKLVRCKKLDEPLPVELARWLESCPRNLKNQLLRIGLLQAREAQAGRPLKDLLSEFIESRKYRGCVGAYIDDIETRLENLFDESGFSFWTDVDAQKIERFLSKVKDTGKAPRTVNAYLEHFKAFHNWLLDMELIARPLPGLRNVKKLDEKIDQRKVRRALTIDEIQALLDAAKQRPLTEAELINRGPDKGKRGAKITPETKARLELLGRERALIYETAFYTGLRKKELASLFVRDVKLKAIPQKIILGAKNEKARRGAELPLRADLAAELKDYIERKGLAQDDKLFTMPNLRTFKADLAFAGVEQKDAEGRTVDFHGLRTSFATHLSKSGVHPRVAQAALRHSDIRLTMAVYTDPKLLDVCGAIDQLPGLNKAESQIKTA